MGEGVLGRTALALRAAGRRRDSRSVFGLGALGYLLVYLLAVGDLGPAGGGSLTLQVVDDLSVALSTSGFFRFEPVAAVSGPGVTVLLSPGNLLVGGVLATLVGANLALTYLGVVQPRACGLESSTGVLAGVPALLSGAACCGPTVLLVLGIQASASLIGVFQLLVPFAAVLLGTSLLLIGRRVDPSTR